MIHYVTSHAVGDTLCNVDVEIYIQRLHITTLRNVEKVKV